MRLFEKKFTITGWRGNKYSLTAKELYERVMADSKFNYNWIAPATELVRVCNEKCFPEEYAKGIKIAILNCFANLETRKEEDFTRSLPTDRVAVYSCYDSLDGTDADVVAVKCKYLMAVIDAVTKYTQTECRFPLHLGPTYQRICEQWKKSKFHEYVSKEHIFWGQLRQELNDDFEKTIQMAEEEGAFTEDDEKYFKELEKFLPHIHLGKS